MRIGIVIRGGLILLGILAVWIAWWVLAPTYDEGWVSAVRTYLNAQDDMFAAAMAPGAGENRARQELNILLNRVLMEPMSDETRLTLARRALEHLARIDGDIDRLNQSIDRYTQTVAAIEDGTATGFGSRKSFHQMSELVRAQQEAYRGVSALSSVIQDRARDIFERIIADGGRLTADHIRSLNEQVDDAEAQYDSRAALLRDIQTRNLRMRTLFDEMRNAHRAEHGIR